jgi:hypothetical protein
MKRVMITKKIDWFINKIKRLQTEINNREFSIRIIIVIIFLVIWVYFLLMQLPNIPKLNAQDSSQTNSSGLIPDYGSLAALVFTISIVILLRLDSEIWHNSKISLGKCSNKTTNSNSQNTKCEDNNLRGLIILALGITAIIAIWLTVRLFGIMILRYVIEPNYSFLVGDLFNLIGFILVANICFTLHTTFAKIKQESQGENADVRIVRGLMSIPIQAVIIGLITILPRYGETGFTKLLGGIPWYVAVVAVLVAVLALLYFIWENLRSKTLMRLY